MDSTETGIELADAADEMPCRQAVVVIHGIGEQKPTETGRGFARSLVSPADQAPDPESEDRLYFAPHPAGEPTDLRLYKINWRHRGDRFVTDVHEAYWAYRFRDTVVTHVTQWLWPLLRGKLTDVPLRLSGSLPQRRQMALSTSLLLASVLGLAAAILGCWLFSPTITLVVALAGLSLALLSVWLAMPGAQPVVRTLLILVLVLSLVLFIVSTRRGWDLGGVLSLVLPAIAAWGSAKLSAGLGDAARYLRVSAGSYRERIEIRRTVVDLLRDLHEAYDEERRRPRYDRIVVVGHSLGSVIGYDALRHYWTKVNEEIGFKDCPREGMGCREPEPPPEPQHAPTRCVRCRSVLEVENAARCLLTAQEQPDQGEGERADALTDVFKAYREAQWGLFQAIRQACPSHGEEQETDAPPDPDDCDEASSAEKVDRWIVSDFVTLGSPLAHVDFLAHMGDEHDVTSRQTEREYPTSPPVSQTETDPPIKSLPPGAAWFRWATRDSGYTESYLHHAALFAATRWTNLYFDNDLIGGCVARLFGPGVYDVKLDAPPPKPLGAVRRYSHSSYWGQDPAEAPDDLQGGVRESNRILDTLIRRTRDQPDGVDPACD